MVSKPGLVNWVFLLRANPDPEFTWIHPTGAEIDYTTLEKYEMDVGDDDQVKLVIADVSLEDTGTYLFNVEVRGGGGDSDDNRTEEEHIITKDVEMTLKFLRSPHLTFDVLQEVRKQKIFEM